MQPKRTLYGPKIAGSAVGKPQTYLGDRSTMFTGLFYLKRADVDSSLTVFGG